MPSRTCLGKARYGTGLQGHVTAAGCRFPPASDKATTAPARAGGRPRACRRRIRAGPSECDAARSREPPRAGCRRRRRRRIRRSGPAGKSSGVRIGPSLRMTARSRALSSSRTLPIQRSRHQAADRRVVDAVDSLAQALGVLRQQDRDQLGDILAAVAQAEAGGSTPR